MKFLIDECLSPALVEIARSLGFEESTHVTWLGLGATADWLIARRAIESGYVFVTYNRRDFLKLYKRATSHSGLICLAAQLQSLPAAQQGRLFRLSLTELKGVELQNEFLDVTLMRDGAVTFFRGPLLKKTI